MLDCLCLGQSSDVFPTACLTCLDPNVRNIKRDCSLSGHARSPVMALSLLIVMMLCVRLWCAEPSLLLEVRKGWMAESHNDCRQTLIANCMQRKREDRFTEWKTGRVVGTGHLEEATSELWDGASSEAHSTAQLEQQTYFSTYSPISSPTLSSSSFSNLSSPLPGPPAGLLRVTGTADARVQEDTSSDPHCLEFNPFFTRMKELSEPGPSTNANPFYSALHEKEQSSEIPSCQPESFSFSLSQFTS